MENVFFYAIDIVKDIQKNTYKLQQEYLQNGTC